MNVKASNQIASCAALQFPQKCAKPSPEGGNELRMRVMWGNEAAEGSASHVS